VAVLLLAIGAMADPTSSYYANLASSLWTTFGPHFGLLALVALVGAIVFGRWTPRWIARATIALSGIAVAGVAFIVGSIVSATVTAGGQANPITGLSLGKMSEPPPDQTETFTTVQGMPLEVAIYSPGAQHQRTDGPVLVYIHGGGFMIGTKTETAADLRWFADQGWAVFSIDYRLFGNDNPTWDKAPVDVACGLAWVGANAASHGGRDGPIVLMGDSAGGNLAINLAYSAALGQVRSTCGTVPTPAAVVVQYPAVDPVATYERGYPVAGFEPQMLMRGYVGGTPTEFPDRIKAISSETYLSNKAPPTLIIEPEKDGLVVSDGVYRFFDKAKAAGIDISMVRIPFANHVYNQIAWNSIGNQARRTITEHYLQSHGLAP
jgi:acetyl esterase/lipase